MSKLKKVLLMGTAYVLVAALAIGGTIAYLQDSDSDVNVMTMGNVSIAQHEYQRATDENGEYKTDTINERNSYVLEDFEQGKALLPATDPTNHGAGNFDTTTVRMSQVDSYGGAQVFVNPNAQDKFVTVENTGKTDAYVRTLVAIECGTGDANLIGVLARATETPATSTAPWVSNKIGKITVDENTYYLFEYVYRGANEYYIHTNGVLPAGETTYPNLCQVYLNSEATNEDCEKLDGNDNGTLDILVLSQAVQADGFADAQTALDTAFGTSEENAAEWFGGVEYPVLGTQVYADNIEDIDFTAENTKFVFNGEFGAVTISELGEGSEIYFNNATVGDLTISDDALLKGTATINTVNVGRNGAVPIALTIAEGDLDIAGGLGVRNANGKSILNIENSNVDFGSIFVGENTSNYHDALAEFNVVDSFLSGEENNLGSTIAVWGRSGVKATIYDSEIYTYSRGWHQSEDANDNSITIQGATSIDVDIQRSNMHLYGARSIINARQYGGEATTVTTNIDESLIWVVTKSSHGENTIPVWGFNEENINDTILLFTKNVHQSTPAVFKSFVYGNPVIHGDYHVTTQCQWDAPIALADAQTVTFANDANVSIYDDAGNVEFVKTGSAKVIVEDGAVVENINGID